jgi:LPXTG-motif cell wall-anchored protein
LPDTSTGGQDGGLFVVLGLGAVVVASSTYGAMRRSAAR